MAVAVLRTAVIGVCNRSAAEPIEGPSNVQAMEMAMGKWRDGWTKFKKAHPSFEKSKKFKSDVGPLMDDYEKACAKCEDALGAAVKAMTDLDKRGEVLLSALKGYKGVIDDVGATDRRIDGDFKTVLGISVSIQRPVLNSLMPLHTGRALADFV